MQKSTKITWIIWILFLISTMIPVGAGWIAVPIIMISFFMSPSATIITIGSSWFIINLLIKFFMKENSKASNIVLLSLIILCIIMWAASMEQRGAGIKRQQETTQAAIVKAKEQDKIEQIKVETNQAQLDQQFSGWVKKNSNGANDETLSEIGKAITHHQVESKYWDEIYAKQKEWVQKGFKDESGLWTDFFVRIYAVAKDKQDRTDMGSYLMDGDLTQQKVMMLMDYYSTQSNLSSPTKFSEWLKKYTK